MICGEPIVVYRKLDGSIVALPDMCPHRILLLSMDLREGDDLRCRYHGLKIGPDGMPTEMPLKDDPINKTLCLTPYPAVEVLEINKDARMNVLNIDSGGSHSRKVIERIIKENA